MGCNKGHISFTTCFVSSTHMLSQLTMLPCPFKWLNCHGKELRTVSFPYQKCCLTTTFLPSFCHRVYTLLALGLCAHDTNTRFSQVAFITAETACPAHLFHSGVHGDPGTSCLDVLGGAAMLLMQSHHGCIHQVSPGQSLCLQPECRYRCCHRCIRVEWKLWGFIEPRRCRFCHDIQA